jgi:hypothetical protein
MTKEKTRHHRWIMAIGAAVAIALTGTWAIAQCCSGPRRAASPTSVISVSPSATAAPAAEKCPMCKDGKMCKGCKAKSRQASHAKLAEKVSGALKNLSAAEAAIKAGEKQTALAELAKVRKVLEDLQARVKPSASKGVVNSVCPIMGGKFDPNKIKANLVVAYKDGKVGFCCAMCVPKWNKLSDTEKDKKLAALAKKK